jgi:hypothetical protein
VAPAEAA